MAAISAAVRVQALSPLTEPDDESCEVTALERSLLRAEASEHLRQALEPELP